MRKLALAGSALLVMAALSCTRELDIETPVSQEYVFEAVWADGSGTRTALQEDGTSVWWTTGEEINVFYGGIASGKFVSTNTEPAALTSFSGSLPVVTGTVEGGNSALSFWGVYPYDAANTCDGQSVTLTVSSTQPATDGSFADKFFPAIARSQDFALAFYNVCGGARFSVANEGIYAVTFEAVGGENLVGKVKVGFGDDGKPVVQQVSEGSTEVTVNAPAGGFVPGKYYFAAFLPGTLSQGVKITYRTATQSASITLSKSLTVNRSRFGTIDRKDEGLTFVDGGGAEGAYAMPEAVDLGLSVKWASFNLGATKPEEFGNYYAWGETEPKETYNWAFYRWCKGYESTLTKYCVDSEEGYNGFTDGKTLLTPDDDAVTVHLGAGWRTPTITEWLELVENCIWTGCQENGVSGIRLTSKVPGYTGNSIFLPAASLYYYGNTLYHSEESSNADYGLYWSSQVSDESSGNACTALFASFESEVDFDVEGFNEGLGRCCGLPLRPVYGSSAAVPVESVSLDKTELNLVVGEEVTLEATVLPQEALCKTVFWESNNEGVATVNWHWDLAEQTSTEVQAKSTGTAVITAKTFDGRRIATCEVTVTQYVVPEAVDMGLSVKWASFNVAATKPEEAGNYYAWGELMPEEEYTEGNYWHNRYCVYRWSDMNYYNRAEYNNPDNRVIVDLEDDVAYKEFGSGWRIPTQAEAAELVANSTWVWKTVNGINGYQCTSKLNGNTLFFPASGYYSDTQLNYSGHDGMVWTASRAVDGQTDNYSYVLGFSEDGSVPTATAIYMSRYCGVPVRAVYGDAMETSVSLDKSELALPVGGTSRLSATVHPEAAVNKYLVWSSSDERVAIVSWDGEVEAVAPGYASIEARTVFGDQAAYCEVTVTKGQMPIPEAIDLGLSVKWASFNVGASQPEKFGKYYAWGEIEPKEVFSWSNYRWYSPSLEDLTKYLDEDYEQSDHKTKLDKEDDAAWNEWGGKWRMPTKAEMEELKSKCTWKLGVSKGVYGAWIFSKKNDNSIFLPLAGYYDDDSMGGANDVERANYVGSYWTSSLNLDYWGCWRAYSFSMSRQFSYEDFVYVLDSYDVGSMWRDYGLVIRAVSD